MKKGFIKIMREAETLLDEDPNAFLILAKAAFRADYDGPEVGVGKVGWTMFKFTRQCFREACKRTTIKGVFCNLKTTNKGTVIDLMGYSFANFDPPPTTSKQPSDPPITTISKKRTRKEIRTPLTPQGVTDEVWHEYLRTRTRLKAPNTERAITTLTNRIGKLSQEYGISPNELVAEANMNGWKSVYPPKEKTTHGRNPTPREIAAELATPSLGRTLFDAPIDLRGSFHQGGIERQRHDEPLVLSASHNDGQSDQTGGDGRG